MDIKHSRRLLVIGATGSGALDILKDLTGGTPPLNENGSTAGLTHEWIVETAYYTAKVPIWVDEISDLEQWETEFLKPEAKEVVDAIGGWVYCFRSSTGDRPSKEVQNTMRAIQRITEEHADGYGVEGAMLAVRMPSSIASSGDGSGQSKAEDWEDACLEYGFEYVDYSAKGTNEFGEKQGFERLKEALEANEWTSTLQPDADPDINSILDSDTEDMGEDAFTRRDKAEMTAELFGMKAALAGAEDLEPPEVEEFEGMGGDESEEKQVEDLDRLMGRLLAVKEQSAELPEAQRRRMAARAVREVMGEGGGMG